MREEENHRFANLKKITDLQISAEETDKLRLTTRAMVGAASSPSSWAVCLLWESASCLRELLVVKEDKRLANVQQISNQLNPAITWLCNFSRHTCRVSREVYYIVYMKCMFAGRRQWYLVWKKTLRSWRVSWRRTQAVVVRTDNTRLTNKLLSRYSHDQNDEDNISNTILARLLFSLVITAPDRRQAS